MNKKIISSILSIVFALSIFSTTIFAGANTPTVDATVTSVGSNFSIVITGTSTASQVTIRVIYVTNDNEIKCYDVQDVVAGSFSKTVTTDAWTSGAGYKVDVTDSIGTASKDISLTVTDPDAVAAALVVTAIGNIGTVTYPGSGSAITSAEAAYAALTVAGKAKVTNYATLTAARTAYDALKAIADADAAATAAAAPVITAINNIGTVVYPGSGSAITSAETAYAGLSAAAKAKVTNYSTLTAARTAYDALKADADAATAAAPVITAIGNIGTVTYPGSGAAITAARTAYDALSAAAKAKVTNYATLTAAETAYATLKATDDGLISAAAPVVAAINDIGTVAYTAVSKGKIVAAETAYAALSPAAQAKVTNYSTLTAARTAFDALVATHSKLALTVDKTGIGNPIYSYKVKRDDTYLGTAHAGDFWVIAQVYAADGTTTVATFATKYSDTKLGDSAIASYSIGSTNKVKIMVATAFDGNSPVSLSNFYTN